MYFHYSLKPVYFNAIWSAATCRRFLAPGLPNLYLSDKIKKLKLNAQDKADLVEFMKALTGDFPKMETDRLTQ